MAKQIGEKSGADITVSNVIDRIHKDPTANAARTVLVGVVIVSFLKMSRPGR